LSENALRVGVDLGGTKVHSVVLSEDNQVVARDIRLSGHGNDEVFASLKGSISDALKLSGKTAGPARIGIGTPGTVDTATGLVTHSLNLGIESLNLGQLLSDEFGCPVGVHNDVNATAAGLAILNPQLTSLAYLNFGTGLAAGFVSHGVPHTGFSGIAGEIGHIPVGSGEDECPCGQRGCLELYTSWSGLKKWANGHETFGELAAAMDSGKAPELRETFLTNAVRVITTVFLSMDPERVYVGGGLISSWAGAYELLLSRWQENIASSKFLESSGLTSRVELLPAQLPIAAIGALGQ
jgi:glucokinase